MEGNLVSLRPDNGVDTEARGEEALLNLVPSGLKGKIVRVGNLMSRNARQAAHLPSQMRASRAE